jgi:7-keto-8-aminopelargonate synthetase-like enzyme
VVHGLEVLEEVVLNQVLVRARDAATTTALLAAVQADGRLWCGPTVWDGEPAIRISVSSWSTTAADAERAADAICELAAQL